MSVMMTVTENSARNFNSATVHWAKSSSKATPLNPHTKQKISKQKREKEQYKLIHYIIHTTFVNIFFSKTNSEGF
jgi:hypothetical protein